MYTISRTMLQGIPRSCCRPNFSSTVVSKLEENVESEVPETPEIRREPLKTTLNERHRIIAEGGIPPVMYEFEREKWALGQRFGKYGVKGGVDIRQLWPTVEEVEEVKALRMYRTAKEAEQISKMRVEQEQLRRKNRLDRIERNWETYEQQMAEFEQRDAKASEERITQEKELETTVRRVQDYFGYYVDPNDPRFSLMIRELDERARLEEKQAKKEKARLQKLKALAGQQKPEEAEAEKESEQQETKESEDKTTQQ